MPGLFNNVPRLALFLAGMAAGAISGRRKRADGLESRNLDSRQIAELRESLNRLEMRFEQQTAEAAARIQHVETRMDEQSAKLLEAPTMAQIAAAMEQVLSRTMTSLDERLATQAHSIEMLKMTVSQTDSLLERVLESLDSLQSIPAGSKVEEALLHRPAV